MSNKKETITITFGDVAENHVGMQKIGTLSEGGITNKELKRIKRKFKENCECKIVKLNELLKGEEDEEIKEKIEGADDARILIIRNGVNFLLQERKEDTSDLRKEMTSFEWDSKARMYGRVVNKHARHNVCFGKKEQEPNYEEGKGRVVPWKKVRSLKFIKKKFEEMLRDVKDPEGEEEGEKEGEEKKKEKLQGEGNRYYDVTKCGIGYHGDAERRKVIALRLGASMKICFQWYYKGKRVGSKYSEVINDGDIYIMNWKACGFDWKKRNIFTLRHAAGCDKFTN